MDTNSGKQQKILIVDDEAELAGLYLQRFINEGYDVRMANDGEAGVVAAREFKPDLILLDLMMPKLSGFDAIDLFRGTIESSASKIIVLSALSRPEDIEKAKKWGADDYIVKADTSINDVVLRVKAALGSTDSDAVPDGIKE